ncbi:hypothetical protein Pelo_15833 [Pelomyxa schiedti]|nr:hypothetical protein Pelo_15829 [Pelomyxa schiedti]KAH3742776.1 hypothetical protein Pelo_15833 [Pelomyxa schiedti]
MSSSLPAESIAAMSSGAGGSSPTLTPQPVNVEKFLCIVEKPLERNYDQERAAQTRALTECDRHPLIAVAPAATAAPASPLTTKPKSEISTPLDPLGASAMLSNPLVVAAPATTTPGKPKTEVTPTDIDSEFIPWSAMKPNILQEFTTNLQLEITVSFISTPTTGKVKVQQDRTASRLEELEQGDDDKKELKSVTQQEYVAHIEKMNTDLNQAWNMEDRVRTLKIAIQCAKLLIDTSVVKFYPSKFVLITEILDTFGRLVFERIKARRTALSPVTGTPLPEKDIPPAVKELATETCRNWFYKIASIRELLPRLYTEMAILKCYAFVSSENQYKAVIDRLNNQIRGCGDPLVQFYTQCYLARKAHEVLPYEKGYLLRAFSDLLQVQECLGSPKMEAIRRKLEISYADYMHLFSPGLEWLLQCISYRSPPGLLEEVLQIFKKSSRVALFLNHIISAFPPSFITTNTLTFTSLIKEAELVSFPQHQLYRTLGVNLSLGSPPHGQELSILNEIWSVVANFSNAEHYITVAEVFIEYCLKHLTTRDTNKMLMDILNHLRKDADFDVLQPHLLSVIQKVIINYNDMSVIFGMENFSKILDLLSGQTQIAAAKLILDGFSKHKGFVTDPVIINTLFNVSTTLHDTVNSLTVADEVRQITRVISHFITKIDYNKDVEKQLNFYVECRQCFANLDGVKDVLVQCVCRLAMKTLSLVHGKHTRKTAPFIRACIAYCYITIPSMEDVFSRLRLSLLAAEVSLLNQAIPQADALLRAAVTLVPEIPLLCGTDKSVEEELASFMGNLSGLLVVAPGHPDSGSFYLIQGLMKLFSEYPWLPWSTAKINVYGSLLKVLFALHQDKLPYHIEKVDSNDTLYKEDPDYQPDLQKLASQVFSCMVEQLEILKQNPDLATATYKAALDILNTLVCNSVITSKTVPIIGQLLTGLKPLSDAYGRNTLQYITRLSASNPAMVELSKKLAPLVLASAPSPSASMQTPSSFTTTKLSQLSQFN